MNINSIKYFLKPNRKKFFIFLITFTIFVPFIKPPQVLCDNEALCPQPGIQSFLTLFIFFGGIIEKINFDNLIIGLALSYLFACLLTIKFFLLDWKKILLAVILYFLSIFIIEKNTMCLGEIGVTAPCPNFLDIFILFFPLLLLFYIVLCLIIVIINLFIDFKVIIIEKIKYFFKPIKNKIALFVLLFSFFMVFFGDPYRIAMCDPCGCNHRWGYPFTFVQEIREKPKTPSNYNLLTKYSFCGPKYKSYNYLNLFYDIIFWYFISCFIIFTLNKTVNKSHG